jgi:hypothetical protein
MGWIEPVSTAVTAASLAGEMAKSSGFVKKHAKRILYLLQNGKAVIPVFGAGGAGKSTAGKILTGTDPLDVAQMYEEDWLMKPVKLTEDVPGQLLIAPGQIERIEPHWPRLMRSVAEGRSFGVINVVAYGHHTFMLPSYREHGVYRDGDTEAQFLTRYTEHRRAVEVEVLKKLLEGLSTAGHPFWMVTLVNKQDLWWASRDEVRRSYAEGEYGQQIDAFRDKMGSTRFQHEYLPVSLALQNLTTGNGEILAQTSRGYDVPRHVSYLRSMLGKIRALLDQGKPK